MSRPIRINEQTGDSEVWLKHIYDSSSYFYLKENCHSQLEDKPFELIMHFDLVTDFCFTALELLIV